MTRRTLRTATGSAIAYDQGAHLAQWCLGDVPVIWVSAEAVYTEGTAIHGGVPICFPWFGAGPTGDLSPSHGFARTAPWRLVQEENGEDLARWAWELTAADVAGAPGVEHFPHQFTARLAVEIGAAASIALTVRNDSDAAFDYEAALHTYLHVGDVRQVTVEGLEGRAYLDKVTGSQETQQGALVLTGEADRVYSADGTVVIHDPVLGRTLSITKGDSPTTVVWNPWDTKAAAMSDLGDREWTQMLCVEAAAVGEAAPRLAPGEARTLSTRISVAPSCDMMSTHSTETARRLT